VTSSIALLERCDGNHGVVVIGGDEEAMVYRRVTAGPHGCAGCASVKKPLFTPTRELAGAVSVLYSPRIYVGFRPTPCSAMSAVGVGTHWMIGEVWQLAISVLILVGAIGVHLLPRTFEDIASAIQIGVILYFAASSSMPSRQLVRAV